jgi:hypothetical protein
MLLSPSLLGAHCGQPADGRFREPPGRHVESRTCRGAGLARSSTSGERSPWRGRPELSTWTARTPPFCTTSAASLRGTNAACASDLDYSSTRIALATVPSDHTSNSQSSESASGEKCACGCWCPWVSPYARIACPAGVKSHTREPYARSVTRGRNGLAELIA